MTAIDPQLLEQLSAWMDGELPADEARFLQRRLRNDVALREQWERWQVASACLKCEPLRRADAGMADRIAAAIAPLADQESAQAPRGGMGWRASAAALVLAVVMLPGILAVDNRRPAAPEAGAPVALAPSEPVISPTPDAVVDALPPMSPLPSVRDFPLVMRPGQAWPRSPALGEAVARDGLVVRGPQWLVPVPRGDAAPATGQDERAAGEPEGE